MRDERLQPPAPYWLVLGASGMVGRCLLPQLAASVLPVSTLALSRKDPPVWTAELASVAWHRGDLFRDRLNEPIETVVSAGPLDGLVAWLQRDLPPALRRVVALSSTSVHVKQDSPDPVERETARKLFDAEAALARCCEARGVRWTILRPTLIHGAGSDRTLAAVARVAQRLHCFALPADARGRRQPVHAREVADAMLAAAAAPAAVDRAYDLPGGETLTYDAMVRRVLAGLPGRPRLLMLPPALFRACAAVARTLSPALRDATPAVLARMAVDLVFDATAARRDFGYAPAPFEPSAPVAEAATDRR